MNKQSVPQESNNGVLNSTHAMPMKMLTTDNGSSFGLNRMLFQRSYQPPVNYSHAQNSESQIKRQSPAIQHGFILDGPKSAGQKKWIGGNRDASDITARRRVNSTGSILNTPGPQSFKNPTDNNPRIEALARVRGGGARVPPKVTNRPVFTSTVGPTTYYRILSAGLSAMYNGLINANGISPGFYSYTPTNTVGTALANLASSTFGRSYNVMTIHRTTGVKTFNRYDVFGGFTATLISALNALTPSYIVVIATYDEPKTAGDDGNIPLPPALITAMKRCGASSTFGSAPSGFIQFRGAYILVGIPDAGVGNGLERYVGSISNDTNAYIDLRISVDNGQYTLVSG